MRKYIINDEGRECCKCEDFKKWEYFPKSKRKAGSSYCKDCKNEMKREYRKTIKWQIATRNYHVKKRADPDYRDREKEQYKLWRQNNKETRNKSHKRYQERNKDRIKERKKELERMYFSPGKKVKFRMWCFVVLENWMNIWLAKNRLKPMNLVSESQKIQKFFY